MEGIECGYCGYLNPVNVDQCINCGEELQATKRQEPPKPDPVEEAKPKVDPKPKVEERPYQRYEPPKPPEVVEPPKEVKEPPKKETPAERPRVVSSGKRTISVSEYKSKLNASGHDGRSTIPLRRIDSVGTGKVPEGFKLISDTEKKEIEFNTIDQPLSRDNVDQGNMSISSKTHARIYYEDGKWLLEDKSSNKATFIQLTGPVELKDGVIIILGQKIFRFQSKD